jgi:hypothetical protein
MYAGLPCFVSYACRQLHYGQQTRGASCSVFFLLTLRSVTFFALLRKTLRISDKTWSLSYTHKWATGFLSRILEGCHTVEDGKTSDLLRATVGFCLFSTRNAFLLKQRAYA